MADQVHLAALALTALMSILGFLGVWYRMRYNSEAHSKSIEELRAQKSEHDRKINAMELAMARELVSKAEMDKVEGRIGDRIDELKALIVSLFGSGSGSGGAGVTGRRKPAP